MLIDNATEGILIGQNGYIKFVNERILELTGYTEEEIYSIPFLNMIHDEYKALMVENYKKRINGEYIEPNYQVRIIIKGNKLKWVEISGTLVEWEGSTATFNFISDITKRKIAEQKLKESEERLQAIFNTANIGISLTNKYGKYIMFNDWLVDNLGYSKEELYKLSKYEITFEEDIQESKKWFDKIISGQVNKYKIEKRFVRKDKSVFWAILAVSTILNEAGNVSAIVEIITDISQRKQIENELSKNQLLLSGLFELSPIGIALNDFNTGAFIDVNHSIETTSGYTKEEFLKLNYCDLTPKKYEEQEIEQIKKMEETGYYGPYIKEYIRKDGTKYPIELNGMVVKDNSNNKLIWSIVQDISERKRVEEEILSKNKDLFELNASKDKFFSIIAHDLRSPFNGFLGLTKLMAENINSFSISELKDISEAIQKSATNLFELLENLLEWSRMQRGAIAFNPENFNLYYLVKQNIEIQLENFKVKQIAISNFVPDDIVLNGDVPMINTVLRNFISNALKFTHKGGSIEIGVNLLENSLVEVFVKDTGTGIEEEIVTKLFRVDEKVSTNGTEGESSTGLGLLLCSDFIKKHNGEIRVESKVNQGSTFSFTLPIGKEE